MTSRTTTETTMTEREPMFWDCDADREHLCYTDIGEAVYMWADGRDLPLPETVTVYGFAHMELPSEERIAMDVWDFISERIDEEYGDPDGHILSKPTERVKTAAIEFARAFRADYKPWACEEVTSVVVKVADHVPAEWMQPKVSA